MSTITIITEIIAGQIMNNECDVAAAEFTLTFARSAVIDFLVSVTELHLRLFIKNPTDSFNWTAYLKPLVWEVWISVLLLVMILPFFVSTAIQIGKILNN